MIAIELEEAIKFLKANKYSFDYIDMEGGKLYTDEFIEDFTKAMLKEHYDVK